MDGRTSDAQTPIVQGRHGGRPGFCSARGGLPAQSPPAGRHQRTKPAALVGRPVPPLGVDGGSPLGPQGGWAAHPVPGAPVQWVDRAVRVRAGSRRSPCTRRRCGTKCKLPQNGPPPRLGRRPNPSGMDLSRFKATNRPERRPKMLAKGPNRACRPQLRAFESCARRAARSVPESSG